MHYCNTSSVQCCRTNSIRLKRLNSLPKHSSDNRGWLPEMDELTKSHSIMQSPQHRRSNELIYSQTIESTTASDTNPTANITSITDTMSTPSGVHRHSGKHATGKIPKAQCAFKILMIHEVLQFALRIAFRCVLHRCGNLDIHRWKL